MTAPSGSRINCLQVTDPVQQQKVVQEGLQRAAVFVLRERDLSVDPPGGDLEREIRAEFPRVFQELTTLPRARHVEHKIELVQPIATNRRIPRMSFAELEEARTQVEALLKKGWVQPSKSPFAANLVFVRKKDGALRMCGDFRLVNQATKMHLSMDSMSR